MNSISTQFKTQQYQPSFKGFETNITSKKKCTQIVNELSKGSNVSRQHKNNIANNMWMQIQELHKVFPNSPIEIVDVSVMHHKDKLKDYLVAKVIPKKEWVETYPKALQRHKPKPPLFQPIMSIDFNLIEPINKRAAKIMEAFFKYI